MSSSSSSISKKTPLGVPILQLGTVKQKDVPHLSSTELLPTSNNILEPPKSATTEGGQWSNHFKAFQAVFELIENHEKRMDPGHTLKYQFVLIGGFAMVLHGQVRRGVELIMVDGVQHEKPNPIDIDIRCLKSGFDAFEDLIRRNNDKRFIRIPDTFKPYYDFSDPDQGIARIRIEFFIPLNKEEGDINFLYGDWLEVKGGGRCVGLRKLFQMKKQSASSPIRPVKYRTKDVEDAKWLLGVKKDQMYKEEEEQLDRLGDESFAAQNQPKEYRKMEQEDHLAQMREQEERGKDERGKMEREDHLAQMREQEEREKM